MSRSIRSSFYYTNNFNKHLVGLIVDKLLSFKGGRRIYYYSGDISGISKISKLQLIYFYYKNNKIALLSKIFKQIFKQPYFYFINLLFSKPKYFFFSNTKMFEKYKKKYGPNKVFAFKNNDLEEFKKLNLKKSKKDIVFIDQVRGEEFDTKVNQANYSADKLRVRQYWNDVDVFINHIEKLLKNPKVKIAAHPRRFKKNFPIKRKFFFNQTPQLIMNSKIVISSVSNSLIYALLMQKPIILIKQKMFDFYSPVTVFILKLFQKKLNLPLIDINNIKEINSLDKKKILQIDKKKYKSYLKNDIQINYFMNKKNIIKEITKNLR